MTLSIIITHYKEPLELVKPLLDSLALQQAVDWKDIEIILVQDGNEGELNESDLEAYDLPIRTEKIDKGGISKARNRGLKVASGEYIMWCDCDDMFLNVFGLHLIFCAIQEKPDVITSAFIEENKYVKGYMLINRDKDMTFVHGKAFRIGFLAEKGLRFDERLTKHEDGCFVATCLHFSGKTQNISTPFYLWKWNPGSVMRKGGVGTALLDTYPELMESRLCFFEGIKRIDPKADISKQVAKSVMDAYYDFNKPEFADGEPGKVKAAARAFRKFYTTYRVEYLSNSAKDLGECAFVARQGAYKNGMVMERMTLQQFLTMISKMSG